MRYELSWLPRGDSEVLLQAHDLKVSGGSPAWLGPTSQGFADAQDRCSGLTCALRYKRDSSFQELDSPFQKGDVSTGKVI